MEDMLFWSVGIITLISGGRFLMGGNIKLME
jgi:hypothetical protein